MQLEAIQQLFDAELISSLPAVESECVSADGCLSLNGNNNFVRLRLWPRPDAIVETVSGKERIDDLKCIDEMPLYPVSSWDGQAERFFCSLAFETLDIKPEWQDTRPDMALLSADEKTLRVTALNELVASIPDDIRTALDRVTSDKWLILHCCSRSRYFRELFVSNPQLAFLLSLKYGNGFGIQEKIELMDGLARLKRRDLAALAGLPASQSSVHLIRKFTPAALEIYDPDLLGWMLADPLFGSCLPHLRSVGAGLLELMRVLADSKRIKVSTGLLHQVAHEDEQECDLSSKIAAELSMLADCLNKEFYLQNLQALTRAYIKVSAEFEIERVRSDTRRFPSPPLPGNTDIIPITCPAELVREGEEQSNCVASYLTDILNGTVYIYRMIRPERATLEVFQCEEGWELGEIAGPANSQVGAESMEAVQRWFDQCSF